MQGEFKLISFIQKNLQTQAKKIVFTVGWNFRYTLILFFLVFGYYGWGTTSGLSNILSVSNSITTLALILCSIFFYLKRQDFNSHFQGSIRVDFGFFMTAFAFLLFGIFINYTFFQRSLTVDETAYAWGSQLQSHTIVLKIAPFLPLEVLSFNSGLLLQMVSILIFFFGFLFFRILLRIRSDLSFLLITLIATLIIRIGIQYLGGFNGPNSPLANVWYFITSTFLGLRNITYRFSSLTIFCLLASYLYRRIAGEAWVSKFIALLTPLLLFSIPLVNNMSLIVEISTWTFIVSVVVFVELIKNQFKISERVLIFLAITYYLRVTIITIFATILVHTVLSDGRRILQDKWRYIYSICIMLPGLAPVITGRLAERVSTSGNLFTDFKVSAQKSLNAVILSQSSWYLPILIASIIILISKKTSRKYILLLIFFDTVVFLGLNSPTLTNQSKYIIEYLFPLVFIIGFWPNLINLKNTKFVSCGLVVALLAINIYGFNAKHEVANSFSKVYDPMHGAIGSYSVIPFSPFAYREAFEFIKNRNLEPCFNAGVVYSSFPEILEGLSLAQVVHSSQIRSDFLAVQARMNEDWTTISYQSILDSKIDCVILGAVQNQGAAVQELEVNGWGLVAKFKDTTYGTVVYIMTAGKK